MGISLMASGKHKKFTTNDWRLFMKFYDLKSKSEYSYCHTIGNSKNYTYSMKTVDFIIEQILADPENVIDNLKQVEKEKAR